MTETALPLRRSVQAASTTSGASSHMNDGITDRRIPIRWWNSVCTKPGHSAITVTPRGRSLVARLSENVVTHALCAL